MANKKGMQTLLTKRAVRLASQALSASDPEEKLDLILKLVILNTALALDSESDAGRLLRTVESS
jgi:hypothetical protein